MKIQHVRQGTSIILELKASGPKAPGIQPNKPVRLIRKDGLTLLRILEKDGPAYKVAPADKKHEELLDHLLTKNLPMLAYVLTTEKDGACTVQVHSFEEEKPLDITIGLEDGFLEKARPLKLDPNNPAAGMTDAFLLDLDELKYAVMGVHLRAEQKDRMSDFLLAGKDGYLQVKRSLNQQGEPIFLAEKLLSRIDSGDYTFVLVKGREIGFADNSFPARARQATLATMAELERTNQGYLQVWERYGRVEEEHTFVKARLAGAVSYSGFDEGGGAVRLHVDGGAVLEQFAAANVSKDTALVLFAEDPSPLLAEDCTVEAYNQFLERQRQKPNVKLKAIVREEQRIYITDVPDDINEIPVPGYLFLSLTGDLKRYERRKEAKEAIAQAKNKMPQLAAILEGKTLTRPVRQRIEPISPGVSAEVFPTNDPTPRQREAIEVAVNTPDIAIIQGPPGTGKTTVIRAILYRLDELAGVTTSLFGRNLLSAYQHDAVENAVERIRVLGLPAIKLGRKGGGRDEEVEVIERSVEDLIKETRAKLQQRHQQILNAGFMRRFEEIHTDYRFSSNSVENTIVLLQKVKAELLQHLSAELIADLNKTLSELVRSRARQLDPERESLVQCIRRIPVSPQAYADGGQRAIMEAVYRLRQEGGGEYDAHIGRLEPFRRIGQPDTDGLGELREVRKALLAMLLPPEEIFQKETQRSDVLDLFSRIADHLQAAHARSQAGETAVLADYIAQYDENPLPIRKAIMQYMSVLGVTNQQVMGKVVAGAKGDIKHYDNVLVDEAARSNPLDLFIPMSLAKDRIILVGDHRQLPHLVEEAIAEAVEKSFAGEEANVQERVSKHIKESLFQYLIGRLRELEKQDGIKRVVTLDMQYRMHGLLGKFVSENFYEKRGDVELQSPLPDAYFQHQLPGLENKVCVWYDVPHREGAEEPGVSKSRRAEAVRIARDLKKMLDSERSEGLTFGVITFYSRQREVIFQSLAAEGIAESDGAGGYRIVDKYRTLVVKGRTLERVRVGTVDAFQGMEFDVVYLSMVRSNRHPDRTERQKQTKYGHLMVENRLCVSMSRQKRLLIVVGDSGMLEGTEAEKAVPALVTYLRLCGKEKKYGQIIR